MEKFSYNISPDSHSILFQIPQLRKGSSIYATLLQRGLGKLTHTTSIDIGTIITKKKPKGSKESRSAKNLESIIDSNFALDFRLNKNTFDLSDVRDLSSESLESVKEIRQAIINLKWLRREVENQSLIDIGPNDSFIWFMLLSMPIIIPLFVIIVIGINYTISIIRKKAVLSIKEHLIKSGIPKKEAEINLGKLLRMKYKIIDNDKYSELWLYPPVDKFLFTKDSAGCVLLISGEEVADIIYLEK